MGQKSISQLDTISQAHDTDLFEVAAVDAQSASGYKSGKMSAEVMAVGLLSTYTYPTAMPNMQNKTITGALNQLLANFAPAYDDAETYAVGDVCTYNGQLYKCTTAVSTAETFDPTKWAAIVVTELSGGQNYSTSEQVIGTWIDGKPLYQKTFLPNYISPTHSGKTTWNVNIDVHSLSIDTLVSAWGTWRRWAGDDAKLIIQFGSYEADKYEGSRIRIDSENGYTNGQLNLLMYAEGTDWQCVTIQYTKTTD